MEKLLQNVTFFNAGGKTKKTSELLFRHTASCNTMLSMCKILFLAKLYIGWNSSLCNMCIWKIWFAFNGTVTPHSFNLVHSVWYTLMFRWSLLLGRSLIEGQAQTRPAIWQGEGAKTDYDLFIHEEWMHVYSYSLIHDLDPSWFSEYFTCWYIST